MTRGAAEETDDASRSPSRDPSETLFATPAIVADRRADGSIILKSTTPLAARARVASATGWSIGRGRRPSKHLPRRPRQRRRAVVDRHLQGCAEAGALRGRVDSRARPERRASAGDPVRQQRRARAARAGGPACRRALGRDLAGLFADVQGFRQAQEHGQAAGARRDLCLRHKAVRGGAGGDKAAAFGQRSSAAMRRMPTRSRFAPSQPRRKRPMSQKRLPRSRRTRSQNSCSPRARPARRRPSSTPSAC